ncbi:hypothetical protein ACJMK2_026176 [Sinanodonta woodiana]|uniref:Ig-like domain-containing protein n=1 Tax=Sinanodonta woodiana TaxID=1069815 RepID=A0ABD3XJA8_SINWO
MYYTCVAVLIIVLFNTKKSAECDNEGMIAMVGCNTSLTWILPIARDYSLAFKIGIKYERPIATLSSDMNCIVRDNSSMLCNLNINDHGLIVVLNMFNVTEGQSGNYTLWKMSLVPEQSSYTSKNLLVIGKPKVTEVRKPIFSMPFQMTCTTIYEQEHYLYKWSINGIEDKIVNNANSYNISSLGMNDNFSNVTCQICLNTKGSNTSCVTCQHDGCSRDSDPYTIHVLYGPVNVSLSREERHFYLKEHDIFAIDCFANCYPKCIFWWKGRDTIESQNLTIIFESRMAGQYACHVTNQQTNITLASDSITLHHSKEDFQWDNNWLGTVTVCVFLLIVGLVIVITIWRRTNTTRTKDSGKLARVCVQQTQTDVSLTELEWHKIQLQFSSNKGRECKLTMRSECPNMSSECDCKPHLIEDHYTTIVEDPLTHDDLVMDLLIHKNSHETRRNTEHICHVETAFAHVNNENLITPNSDFARPVELFHDEGNEVPDTDHAYLTVINDAVNSMEVCHVEEIDVNDVDKPK